MNDITDTGSLPQRPQILSVFLVFSMVNGILSAFSNLVLYSLIDFVRQTFEGQENIKMMGMEFDLSLFLNTDRNFFLFQGILFIASFFGALMMWNFKKAGFHFYTIAQILLLIVATIYLKGMPFPLFDVLLTAMFIYIYASNLKLMK